MDKEGSLENGSAEGNWRGNFVGTNNMVAVRDDILLVEDIDYRRIRARESRCGQDNL